jgi:hypothetical protein
MTLSKRSEIVVAYGLADVCWFLGIVCSIFVRGSFGASAFWGFAAAGLLCLVHGTRVWHAVGGFPLCERCGEQECTNLMRNLAMALVVYLGIGLMGTPLWLIAAFLARRYG